MGRTPRVGFLVALCFVGLGGATGTARTFVTPTIVLRGLAMPRETAVAENGDLYFTQFPSGQLNDLVTLSRLPSGSTKPIQVYRLAGTGATLSDIHFDPAGNLVFVTLSGPASTLTRLNPAKGTAVVLAKASGGFGPGAGTGAVITLDGVDDSGTVYFTRVSTDAKTGAQTADLLAISPGSSTPRVLTHFAGSAGADEITFLTVTRREVYFVESPSPDAGATLYQLTPNGRRALVRGAAPSAGFDVAAAAFDAAGNFYVLRPRFSGFVRIGCATSTTMRVSRITATDLAVGGTPTSQTVGEATFDGYVGLWVGPHAFWPTSAAFRVSAAGDVYWLQSPVESQCGSNAPQARLSDELVGLAATDQTPTILFTEKGQKPLTGSAGCCPAPMGIATDASGVFLAAFDQILRFGSSSQPPPPPTGVAKGTVIVDGEPFVGGVIKYGWTIDVSGGTLNLNTDVGQLTIYGAPGVPSELMMARPNASQLDLDLIGGDFSVCKQRALAGLDKKKKKKVRLLWAKGKGKFRSAGRDSIASVHGTTWLTEDRCDGTLTAVKEGVVTVRDLRRRKTVTVRAGKSYLARHQASR